MRWRGLEPPRGVNPTRPSTLRVYQFRHQRARAIVATAFVTLGRLTDLSPRYIFQRYEADGGDSGRPRAPGSGPAPDLGLRHQERRRPLDAVFLGRELRADLPRAQAARGRGPDRGRGCADRRTRPARLQAHEDGPRGARRLAPGADAP